MLMTSYCLSFIIQRLNTMFGIYYHPANQSQKTQGFCLTDFATLSDERRSRSKIVLLFDKERCV